MRAVPASRPSSPPGCRPHPPTDPGAAGPCPQRSPPQEILGMHRCFPGARTVVSAVLLVLAVLGACSSAPAATGAAAPTTPIRAAFYYPWYPETWHDKGGPTLHAYPSIGKYASADPLLQVQHIRSMEYAGMDAMISEWTPPPHYRDTRLKQFMATAASIGSPLKSAIYYTPEDKIDPSPAQIAADLRYVRDNL